MTGSRAVRVPLAVLAIAFVASCGQAVPPASLAGSPSPSPQTVVSVPPPTVTQVTPSPPASTGSVTPESTASASPTTALETGLGWQRGADAKAIRGLTLEGVVWTGERFVAVAGNYVLNSLDGRTWNRKAVPEGMDMSNGVYIGPKGLLAGARGKGVPWVAQSADGLAWTWTRAIGGLGNDAVAVDGGWLTVGTDEIDPCLTRCEARQAYVASSSDGITWIEPPLQPELEAMAMTTVAAVPGGFLAGGYDANRPALWSSADGRAWTRLTAPAFAPERHKGMMTEIRRLLVREDVVVAVGTDWQQDSMGPPRAWWSTDGGHSWAEAAVADGQDAVVNDGTVTADGFLMAGYGGAACPGGIWSSADGAAWDCAATDPALKGFDAFALAASPDVEVVVGWHRLYWRPTP